MIAYDFINIIAFIITNQLNQLNQCTIKIINV